MALKLWEGSSSYVAALNQARSKLADIQRTLGGDFRGTFGDIVFDEHEEPYVSLVSNRPRDLRVKSKEVHDTLRRYGADGLWGLDEFDRFAKKWGSLYLQAAFELGYDFDKQGNAVRLKGVHNSPRSNYDRLMRRKVFMFDDNVLPRLNGHFDPHERIDMMGAYELVAGRTGMLTFRLTDNSFPNPPSYNGRQTGHIDTNQGTGPRIRFYNVLNEGRDIIVAKKDRESALEGVVIPSRIPAVSLTDALNFVENRLLL